MPTTPGAMFLHLLAASPITLDVENLQPILASCVGPDSIEARHLKNVSLMSYGGYSMPRPLNNQVRDVRCGLPNKAIWMEKYLINKFYHKEIASHEGVVKM